jgi:tetratricopeptide (TPR) repeat protein
VDLPERQRTLRATVEWSVGLLDDAERSLLETMAVFVDGWTVEAAGQVAGLDEDQALELSEALARHSLIYLDSTDSGPRSRMLETIRVFVAEWLAARRDIARVRRRHAGYYRALAERADRPLRSTGHGEWLERLTAETGNLAAAVRWYLDHDRAPLPHLFLVLWQFWELRDHIGEAREWVGELMPTASLDPRARAELLWTAVATANEVQDDAAALAASQRLAPLLGRIDDPYRQAVCQLVIAWTSPITGDFDGALRQALGSLAGLRAQDEPYWTGVAALSVGSLEITAGHLDDALRHLEEARELAGRFGYSWLAAWSRVRLGTLNVMQGRLDQARELLDEALDLSVAAYVTGNVSLCVIAYAQLALAMGDPEPAALLAGAAEGMRRRAGLGAWPMLRPSEATLVGQIRQALSMDRFERVYEAGTRLSQREAVAAARGTG